MKVSVLLICYNQENYIKDALDSIFMQKTNFEWELLIGEDASPDHTAQRITECIKNVPKSCTVYPYLREQNMGASQNLFDLIKKAKGEYITVLEGDDYWLDENRLQTLADFLDEHPEYAGVSHKRERRQNGELIKHDPDEEVVNRVFTLQDYFDGKRFSAMACLFRNICAADYEGYEHLFTGARNACDQIMCYSILFSGNIFILDKVFGVYRIFSGGYCSRQSRIGRAKDYLIQNRRLTEYFGEHKPILREIASFHADIMKLLLKSEGIGAARRYYKQIPKNEKKGVLSAFFGSFWQKIWKRRK